MFFGQNLGNHVILKESLGHQSLSYLGRQLPITKSSNITLIDNNFDFLPRLFTITTNNGSYKFNVDILKDSSKTISKQLEANPNNLEYHLSFKDDKNTMKKFEDIFYGLSVTFEFDEIIYVRQIIHILNIDNCPIYLKPNINKNIFNIPSQLGMEVDKISLLSFLSLNVPKTFTIKTKKKQYQCSKIGVLSSKVIRDLKTENPEINEYTYNFEDENDEFQNICDLFNFGKVQITVNNMDSLKIIADELKIEPIMNSINEFVNSYENSVQLIDDKLTIIETIDEIFNLLHNIQNLTVESVKKSILHSIWVKTDENVQELTACIFQTVRIGYKLQPYLIDLVVSLNECSDDDKNRLSFFLPYLINQLEFNFSKTPFYASFYLKLAQKGVISMDDALNKAMEIVMSTPKEGQPREYRNKDIVNVLLWFLPELFERNQNNNDFYNIKIDVNSSTFFKKFFPSNVEGYRKMRDSGMPIDDISRAIFTDDVDSLQSIISKRGIDINDTKISTSIFDVFDFGNQISFINYSVMHGSIKCFKYLLLSHAEMDNLTFVLSIYGGNTEIIRLVDHSNPSIYTISLQNHQFFSFSNQLDANYYSYGISYLSNIVSPAIMNHRNDLFDWIFENKQEIIQNISMLDIAFIAVQNGNAHALIQCIDKGLDIYENNYTFLSALVTRACHEGFYRILQLILSFCQDNIPQKFFQIDYVFYTGNVSIYNLMKNKIHLVNQNNFPIINSLKQSNNKLFMAVLEDKTLIPTICIDFEKIFKIIIKNKNTVIFNFLKDKFPFQKLVNFYIESFNIFYILNKSCKYGFFEGVKDITGFILSQNPSADFTSSLYYAICAKQKEIIDYLLDKNIKISIKQSDPKLYAITQIENDNLIHKLLEKIDPDFKDDVLNEIFNLAVIQGNKNLVEFLLDKSRLNHSSLINAVQSSNLDIVNMILSIKSDPAFINIVQKNGSALNIAVQNNKIEIVKRLLSLPKINTFLYDSNDCTPLMTAITNFNIEMIDIFVDFYGDQIASQIWQINKSIQNILSLLSKSDESLKKPKNIPDDDEYDYDENGQDEESHILKVSLFDTKSTFIINKDKIFKTISKLVKFENVDLNCHFSSYTLLSYACEANDFDLFNLLLKSDKVNVNTYSPVTGNTPLIVAVLNNNIQIAQILIEHNQTDINHRNFKGQTALTIAASKKNESIVQIFVNSEKFDPEMSALYDTYFRSTKNISKLLLNVKGFDVNTKMKIQSYVKLYDDVNKNENTVQQPNNIYQYDFSYFLKIPFITPLIKAVIDQQEEMIDLIVANPSFDKEKSLYVDAIFASVYMEDINLFRKLLTLFSNDINLIGNDGRSLLYFSIYMRTSAITTEILNNNGFDSVKSQIVSAFMKAGLFLTTSLSESSIQNKSNRKSILPPFGTPKFGLPSKMFNAQAAGGFGPVVGAPVGAFGAQVGAFGAPIGAFGAAALNVGGGGGGFGGVGAPAVPALFFQNIALINQMNELCDFDELHDNLIKVNEFLPSGKTFFTSINSTLQNVSDVVNLLINRGADPNLVDKNGVYPIEYACQSYAKLFAQAMVHLDNIELTIKSSGDYIIAKKGDTILHMLMTNNIFDLFKEVLDMQELNIINSENIDGDTPLLIACKNMKLNFIMPLFAKDDLDYKHRNKEGKDALDILKQSEGLNNKGHFRNNWVFNQMAHLMPEDIQSEEKREYYKKILEFF